MMLSRSTLSNLYIGTAISTRFYRYAINKEFLKDGIVSHEHAWFWGMVLTDGCITFQYKRNSIHWQQKYDSYNILERLRAIVDSTHNITFQPSGKDGKYASCCLTLSSKSAF